MQKRYQKYPLVFATIVSFLSVCTAGVSTFAWFQAQANVNVRATESSTTITVSNPDSDFAMRIYRYAPSNESYSVPYQPSVIADAISEKYRLLYPKFLVRANVKIEKKDISTNSNTIILSDRARFSDRNHNVRLALEDVNLSKRGEKSLSNAIFDAINIK